jgi:predicted RNase H-like nuclease
VTAVLGIDAAWTPGEPSGVALVRADATGWRTVGVAPSYGQFLDLALGTPVDWLAAPPGGVPDIPELLAGSAKLLGGHGVDVIAVDMPLSLEAIAGRRAADNLVSSAFGQFGCAAHTPNASRPGPIGALIRDQCESAGFRLGTVGTIPGTARVVIEVYPHPALLALLATQYRVPYKLSRSGRYFPGVPAAERRRRVARTWIDIRDALGEVLGDTDLPLPEPATVGPSSTARLKRFEDAIDALICGWVATEYLYRRCAPYGDEVAAIWTPDCPAINIVAAGDSAFGTAN